MHLVYYRQMQITAKESNTLVLAPSSPPQVPQRPAHPGAAVHELGETKTSRAPQTIKNRAPRKKVVADGQGKVQDIAQVCHFSESRLRTYANCPLQITMDQLPKESTVAVEQPNGLVSLPSSPPQQVQQRPAHSDATEYESPETEVTQPPQTIKNRQPRKVVTEEERRTEDNAQVRHFFEHRLGTNADYPLQTVTTRSLERKEEELEDNARPSPIATPWKRQPRKVVAKGEDIQDGIQTSRTPDNISTGTEAGLPPRITGERQPRKPKVAMEASEDGA